MKIPADFHDDGCTWWPDRIVGVNIRPFCRVHDWRYHCGGSKADRLEADIELRDDIAAVDCKWWQRPILIANAQLMYAGVRIGGARHWRIPHAYWGYGWPIEEYGLGYAAEPAVP